MSWSLFGSSRAMSYRDVRNVTEMLRALGYPNLVSMESFRSPNFPLVANLLVWLAKRFDNDADIPSEINTEEERIALIRNAAQFMALKANIKLNTKRLYQADGYAVKELLKITTLLYNALQENALEKQNDYENTNGVTLRDFDISDKVNDLKQSRQLASEITSTGARLYDLLGKEVDLRALRHISAGRQYEVNEVEVGVKEAIEAIKKEIGETKQLIDNVSANEANLDSKIERRKIEIDRYEKRLQTLKKVRPAFLEEFTELESELEKLFVQYALRVRTLNYLERLANNAERVHLERQQIAASQRVIETVPLEKGEPVDLLSFEENTSETNQDGQLKQERPRARTGGRSRAVRTSKTLGELNPLGSLSGSSGDLTSETDTDDLLLDGDEPELPQSDDDSLGLELSAMERPAPSGRKTSTNVQNNNSDDDF